jgi:hypothetical protein
MVRARDRFDAAAHVVLVRRPVRTEIRIAASSRHVVIVG